MAQTTRDLIDSLAETREAIKTAAQSVAIGRRTEPFVGAWNLCDLLAHLVGWDYTNVEAVFEFRQGKLPSFYEAHDPGWKRYNATLLERHGTDNWDALNVALSLSGQAVVTMLRTLSDDEVTESPVRWRGRPVSIATILRAAIRDEREHLEQIRQFSSRPQS